MLLRLLRICRPPGSLRFSPCSCTRRSAGRFWLRRAAAGRTLGGGRRSGAGHVSGGTCMITMLGSPRRCCDGLTRRETLRAGALSLLGGAFHLPGLFALEEQKSAGLRPGKAKSVILLYLLGGAATQDMWDLKPDAPDGVRSEFRPIDTSAAGVRVCEHLPRMARWMHRAALVRSLNHKAGCHNCLPSYTGCEVPQ